MGTFLQVEERDRGGVTILQVKGQMVSDHGGIPLCKDIKALVEHGRAKLVFDMHDVSFIDSAGIGALVNSLLCAQRCGGAVKLLHVPARAGQLLKLCGLDDVFETYESERAAVESFRPH